MIIGSGRRWTTRAPFSRWPQQQPRPLPRHHQTVRAVVYSVMVVNAAVAGGRRRRRGSEGEEEDADASASKRPMLGRVRPPVVVVASDGRPITERLPGEMVDATVSYLGRIAVARFAVTNRAHYHASQTWCRDYALPPWRCGGSAEFAAMLAKHRARVAESKSAEDYHSRYHTYGPRGC
jgi:hypothetical protein